jgi:hypothetical protein
MMHLRELRTTKRIKMILVALALPFTMTALMQPQESPQNVQIAPRVTDLFGDSELEEKIELALQESKFKSNLPMIAASLWLEGLEISDSRLLVGVDRSGQFGLTSSHPMIGGFYSAIVSGDGKVQFLVGVAGVQEASSLIRQSGILWNSRACLLASRGLGVHLWYRGDVEDVRESVRQIGHQEFEVVYETGYNRYKIYSRNPGFNSIATIRFKDGRLREVTVEPKKPYVGLAGGYESFELARSSYFNRRFDLPLSPDDNSASFEKERANVEDQENWWISEGSLEGAGLAKPKAQYSLERSFDFGPGFLFEAYGKTDKEQEALALRGICEAVVDGRPVCRYFTNIPASLYWISSLGGHFGMQSLTKDHIRLALLGSGAGAKDTAWKEARIRHVEGEFFTSTVIMLNGEIELPGWGNPLEVRVQEDPNGFRGVSFIY